jgi:hypothetical protein
MTDRCSDAPSEDQAVNNELQPCPSHQTTVTPQRRDQSSAIEHIPNAIPMTVGNQDAEPKKPYSVFTVPQKRAIILSGSFIAMLSYMSSSIFYPAVDQVCTTFA